MNEASSSEENLFTGALTRPVAERPAYLDQACTGQPDLRARVEALLRAHEGALSLLKDSPGSTACTAISDLSAAEKPGTVIGRYKLLEKIGEGGFGSVYMAEQEVPVRRRVALKVIKLGMDTQEVVARFEAERQALAMMDHPNIAKVLDGGATDAGRPYFVMELVKGVPITTYCDQRKLSTPARLELFMLVCLAVQHAHQKGIIHRDLKPSNILVTEQDDRAVPKVIDFGVARATQARLTEKTMFTQFQQMVGTPTYMSPEQTGLGSLDVDTRSDIYSLGVLLYELLTGSTPFDAKKLFEAGYEGIMRTIREVEPPKPSTRLSTLTMEELTQLGSQRHENPRQLGRRVQGDLDWIVMKALEKDRKRRYETASDIAADLQRHLGHEPVVARPAGSFYRFRKFVRRNRVTSAATAAVMFALVAGFGVARWQKWRADQSSSRNAATAAFLKTMLTEIAPTVAKNRDPQLMKDFLDETARRVARDLAGRPEVRVELCDILGDVYWALGEPAAAEAMFREALAVQRSFRPEDHREVVREKVFLANFLHGWGIHPDEAETLRREVLAHSRTHPVRDDVTESLFSLASTQVKQGKYVEARVNVKEALASRTAPDKADSHTAWWLANYVWLVRETGDLARAEAMCREALAVSRKAPPYREQDAAISRSLGELGAILMEHGDYQEAEKTLREALALQRKRPGIFEGTGATLRLLEQLLIKRGDSAAAETMAREQLASVQQNFGPASANVLGAHRELAKVLMLRGDFTGAETEARAVLATAQARMGPNHPEYAEHLTTLVAILLARDDSAQAETVSRQALTILQQILGAENPWTTPGLHALALVQAARGDLPQAIASRRQALDIFQKHLGLDHPAMTRSLLNLAGELTAHGDFTEAETRLKAAWRVEQALNYYRDDEQHDLHENFAKLYAAWAKADPIKGTLAADWQGKLEQFNAAQKARLAAPQG